MNYELLSLAIGTTALVISLITVVRTRKNTSKLIELEEIHAAVSKKQLEEYETKDKEKNKTTLQATLELEPKSKGKFVVQNSGQSKAKNINLTLINNMGKGNPIQSWDYNEKNPYLSLNPKERYFIKLVFSSSDTATVYEVELSWENEDGSFDKKQFVLSK